MHRGYTFLWRKTWVNPLLMERGKKYSRLEAWLYLTNVLAAGMDVDGTGLKRGEFVVSIRYLARRFNWSHGMAQRFIDQLLENSMISRVARESIHQAGHFIVCNNDIYNPARYTERSGRKAPSPRSGG
jgi:hypothetical protein